MSLPRLALLATLGLAVAGTAVAVVTLNRSAAPPPQPEVAASVSPIPSANPTTPNPPPTAPATGRIEGSLVFPGQAIPTDLRVCAVNLNNQAASCTEQQLSDARFKNSRGYQLELAPGNYHVYATVSSFDPGYRAYYSRFVSCGYQAGCTDHTPLTVTVAAGQTVNHIEPGDFYR